MDRVGDFLIVVKDNYALTDGSNSEYVGYHGALTDWEIKVPLIYF